MNRPTISIRLKITSMLALLTTLFIFILYLSIEKIIVTDISQIERQKAEMIAKTIEPTIAMNRFLQLDDENREYAKKILENEDIPGLCIYFEGEALFMQMPADRDEELFKIEYPIKDVMLGEEIGSLLLHYTKRHYHETVKTVRERFFFVAAMIVAIVILIYFVIRYLFRPLEQITASIARYRIGDAAVDFSNVKREVETDSVIEIISDLVGRVNEHNQLMEVKQRELLEARETADAANRSKSMFLANMSHEIRTPMNAIVGFVDILSDMETNPVKSRYIQTIRNSGQSLLGIINDILDFSKIESGKFELEWHEFNPRTEFNTTFSLFCSRCSEKEVTLDVEIDAGLPRVMRSDALRIKQVMTNLIGNALKFTESHGTVTVAIRYDDEKKELFFGVRDSGIGISEANQQKIFEAFSQEDATTTRRFGGTGLGLSISLQLVGMLGGTLQLESKEGEGSHFFFTLPLSPDPGENLEYADRVPTPDSAIFEKMHVALMLDGEDDAPLQRITEYLRSFGVGSIDVLHDEKALDGKGYDLLFVDYSTVNPSLQSRLDKGHSMILLQSGPKNRYASYANFHGKFIALDCFFSASSIFDAMIMLLMDGFSVKAVQQSGRLKHYRGKVLVVEDNEANRALMVALLGARGITFEFAVNGAIAVEMYESNRYDLILMDENMPVLDGIGATRKIRSIENEHEREPTPVVALTANALKGDRERFLDAGMDDYLSKPIEQAEMDRVLSTYLEVDTTQQSQPEDDMGSGEEASGTEEAFSLLDNAAKGLGLPARMMPRIAKSFIESARKNGTALQEAVAQNDLEKIVSAAHALLGTSRNMRIERIGDAAFEIEQLAKKGEAADYADLVEKLSGVIESVIKQLQEEIDSAGL